MATVRALRTDDFDYVLPRALIADRPAEPRDAARLLVVGRALEDRLVRDLPDYLRDGDSLVVNETRVIPALIEGRRGGARIRITLHQALDGRTWHAFARPAKRLRPGDRIDIADDFAATVLARNEDGTVTLAFASEDALRAGLARHGRMPLPPYIARAGLPDERDARDYQTVYARHDGAVAAPTAGLHLTDALIEAIAARGVALVRLTLHVGAGTFLPVKVEHIADHRMHAETGFLDAAAAATLNARRRAGGRIVAVGTTSLRLLETACGDDGVFAAFGGETRLFITPGYRFRAADALLTNFHLPRSTLLMLVAAFAGQNRIRAAYAHAIAERYRFYSYGDATLLLPEGAP
ncbi:MAG: tRNA preQ1(34) S-adenosylmethionine ribosyltransferase-isomerase QueA [Alphaproteobacteria bacterium]|nr:tRNA preQ1(34) S-adenosylmethionine ribosyltransferase-isomerase QueA [Alphaproteobacteria bacterium]